MNTRIRILVVVCFAAFPCGFSPARGQAADADGILGEIRAAMADRDLTVAKAKLAEAAQVGGDEAFTSQCERLQLLYDYLEAFWKAVDEGAKSLQPVDELTIGELRVAVVEYQPGELVLRVQGLNRRYTVKTLPAAVALKLAERVVKPDAPENKIFFGSFLLMDGKGDREKARKLLTEAQKDNADVAALLPELDITPVASLPVEIPPVTPIMRKQLAPASWTLRRQAGDRVVRDSLKDNSEQTAAGHLQVTAPSGEGESQLVFSRKLAGQFRLPRHPAKRRRGPSVRPVRRRFVGRRLSGAAPQGLRDGRVRQASRHVPSPSQQERCDR